MAQIVEVNGEDIEFPDNMTNEQIAQAIRTMTGARQPQAGPVMGAPAAALIPGQSAQAPAARPAAPSGFAQGLLDPFRGGVQLVTEGLGAIGFPGMAERAAQQQQSINALEAEYQQQRQAAGETGFDVGRLAGNVVNPANLLALPARGVSTVRGAIQSGGVAGAMQPVVSSEDAGFAEQKAKQVAGGSVAGVVGGAAQKAAGQVLNPLVSNAEKTMKELGVQMTPGQLMGGQAKNIEEFAANMPLIGSYISDAKEKAIFSFNKGVINKALAKVDDKLPADVIGRDAVQYANQVVDNAYDDVLSKMSFQLDYKTFANINKAIKLPPSAPQRQQVKEIIDQVVYSRLPKTGKVTGQEYKNIESDLRKTAQDYANSTMAADRAVGEALKDALNELKTSLKQQNPTQTPKLRRVDSAYGEIEVMRTAAANSGALNGVFTPKQYQVAVRQRDASRNKRSFAAGGARGQDVADAAVDILGKNADSTLEGRLAMQTAGGWSLIQNPVVGAAVTVASPLLYSPQGLRVMEGLLRSRPEAARQLGAKLTSRASKEGSITSAQVLDEYNRMMRQEENK